MDNRSRIKLLATGLVCGVCVLACGGSAEPSGDPLLVQGHVERLTGQEHAFDGPVSFGEGSEALITLSSNEALFGDGKDVFVAQQRFSPVPPLPFDFAIQGPLSLVANKKLGYTINVRITARPGELHQGDLVNEQVLVITPPQANVTAQVTGLESCSAPNVGGFCAD
jgi:hypothetical protein